MSPLSVQRSKPKEPPMKRALSLALPLLLSTGIARADYQWAINGARIQSPHPYPPGDGVRPVWQAVIREPEADAISLYFQTLSLGAGDYVVVRGGDGSEAIYTAADGQAFWTGAFDTDTVTVELIADRRGSGQGVLIDRYRTSSSLQAEDIYLRNDMVYIAKAPQAIYEQRGPVARLAMSNGYCTGFLISEDLFMTNNHCVSSQSSCQTAQAQFNYEYDAAGRPLPTDSYACTELLQTDYDYDFSILRLADSPGTKYGWFPLEARLPDTGEQGTIIEHPSADRKQAVTTPSCKLGAAADGNAAESDFKHQCDTESGSSGSPVLDGDFVVIGLHHFGGATRYNKNSANQAVRMDKILSACAVCP
jgi:V8-like Glu-specific endopeptidase